MRFARHLLIAATAFGVVAGPMTTASATSGRAQVSGRPRTIFNEDYLVPTMSVSTNASLTPSQAHAILAAAADAAAVGFPVRNPQVPMTAMMHGDSFIRHLTGGWRLPMGVWVMPTDMVSIVGGADMANVLVSGQIAMGKLSADFYGAQVGDTVTLRDVHFKPVQFTIGAIVPDAFTDYGDLLMSPEQADVLGARQIARITIVNFSSPSVVQAALKAHGIRFGSTYRLRTSWDLKNPDGTLGIAETKALLGEFAYLPTTGVGLKIDPAWATKNLNYHQTFKDIAVNNNCNKAVASAIQGAFTDIYKAGLAKYIDVAESSRYGGCYAGRLNRLAGTFGFVSRHTWGMAIDLNTDTNHQWGIPSMNCDVVRIFRKWGFSWGGNFWPSDGMHFEYVGERRDNIGYKSTYCPNKVPVPPTPSYVPVTTTTTMSPTTTVSPTTVSPTTTIDPYTTSTTTH
jgi:hypothetical protein